MSIPDVTGSAAAKERYIFGTVNTPPTSIAQQAGPALGYPVPADTNRATDARLMLNGGLSEGGTIVVRAMDLAVDGVPRFGVTRSATGGTPNDGSSIAKLTRNFALFDTISLDLGGGDPWLLISAPLLYEETDGTFRLACVCYPSGSGGGGTMANESLLIKSFDPATDTTWQTFNTWLVNDYITHGDTESTAFLADFTAAIRSPQTTRRGKWQKQSGDGLYVAISTRGTITGTGATYSRLNIIAVNSLTVASPGATKIGTGVQFDGWLSDGGMALAFLSDRSALLVVSAVNEAVTSRKVFFYVKSQDLQTWGTVSSNAITPRFSTLGKVAVAGDSIGQITDITFGDSNNGWAVTDKGTIFRTMDGGKSWAVCEVPSPQSDAATFGFEGVSASEVSTGVYAVYAVGWFQVAGVRSGSIYRSADNGATWIVVDTPANVGYYDLGAFMPTVATVRIGGGPWQAASENPVVLPLHGVYFTTAIRGWAVGDKSQILFTSDGGQAWTTIRLLANLPTWSGALYGVVADTADTIMVAGRQGIGMGTNYLTFNDCVDVITNATTAIDVGDGTPPNAYSLPEGHIVSLSRPTSQSVAIGNAATVIYALSSLGTVYRWNGTTTGWTAIETLESAHTYAKIFSPAGIAATAYVLSYQAGVRSRLWFTNDATAAGTFSVLLDSLDPLSALYCVDADTGFMGGPNLWRFDEDTENVCYPALLSLSSGAILLAVNNMTLGRTKIYRSETSVLDFVEIDYAAEFTPQTTSLGAINDDQLRPSFTVADNGDILLAAGGFRRVSRDDGRTWVNGTDSSLPLPFGTIAASTAYTAVGINKTRTIAALGGGRIFAAVNKPGVAALGVFVARDWVADGTISGTTTANASTTITGSSTLFLAQLRVGDSIALSTASTVYAAVTAIASDTSLTVGTALGDGASQTIIRRVNGDYMPMLDSPQWLGIKDIRGLFAGHPAVGDYWTIAVAYDYAAANLMMYDSPSVQWRSTGVDTELILLWDRQAAATVAVLGAGQFWDVSAFSLFGSNLRQVYFGISSPWSDGTFTEYLSSLSHGSGKCVGLKTSGACNVLVCTLANGSTAQAWTPGQFNPWCPEPMPGRRQYYVRIATSPESVYRIVRSTRSELVIEANAAGLPTVATATDFIIFGDRHAWWGENATSGPGSTSLRDSTYRYGRYVRVRIPAQPTADGYFAVGTPILGTEPYPDAEGRSFAYGFTWNPITNTTQERGLSGVTSVETHGGTGQGWTLVYQAEKRDAVMRKLHPLVDQMRKLFAFAPKGNDVDSIELVRLMDAQKVSNLLGDRFSSQWVMEDVP